MPIREIGPYHSYKIGDANIHVYYPKVGDGLNRHDHLYAHVTACYAGSIVVRKEGKELVMTKETMPVFFKANEWHEIECLEEGTIFTNVFQEGKF
jgi:quercetin dioxygenase-like cupin family protein